MADQMVSNGKNVHQQEYAAGGTTSSGITRERSFVRSNSQQNHHPHHHQHHHQQNKRRSLAFNHDIQQQLRAKPAIEIYRPPSMCNVLFINMLLSIIINANKLTVFGGRMIGF